MTAPQTVADVCDDQRFAFIEELADTASSRWRSIAEAAYRRERLTIETHCRQTRAIAIAAFQAGNELTPGAMELSPEARELWIEFHDAVETAMRPDGAFTALRTLRGKRQSRRGASPASCKSSTTPAPRMSESMRWRARAS